MEKELIAEIKKTLTQIAEKNPEWRLVLGRKTLSATDVIKKLNGDRKLKRFVLTHYIGLAIEMEIHAREKRAANESEVKLEGNSGSPEV